MKFATFCGNLQDVFFYHIFFPHRSKAVGRTHAYVGRSEPNICQLLIMFGGIVDISKGPGSPHTWSVPWPRLGMLQNGYNSLVLHGRRGRRSRTHFTRFYTFSEENCDGSPTTICEGVPGSKHIPFVAPNWGTKGHKWGLCYSPTHTPSPG